MEKLVALILTAAFGFASVSSFAQMPADTSNNSARQAPTHNDIDRNMIKQRLTLPVRG